MAGSATGLMKDPEPLLVCYLRLWWRQIGYEECRQQKVGFADFTRRIYPLFRRECATNKAGQVRIGRLAAKAPDFTVRKFCGAPSAAPGVIENDVVRHGVDGTGGKQGRTRT